MDITQYTIKTPTFTIIVNGKETIVNLCTLMNLRIQVKKGNIAAFSFTDIKGDIHIVRPNGTLGTEPYGSDTLMHLALELL